jgi:hypothetical protein
MSVRPFVTFASCAKAVTATAVFSSSFNYLFHIFLENKGWLMGVTPNSPKLMLNGEVVATL